MILIEFIYNTIDSLHYVIGCRKIHTHILHICIDIMVDNIGIL